MAVTSPWYSSFVVAGGVGLAAVVEGEGGGYVVEAGECGEGAAVEASVR